MKYHLDTQTTSPLSVYYTGIGNTSRVTKYLDQGVLVTLKNQASDVIM